MLLLPIWRLNLMHKKSSGFLVKEFHLSKDLISMIDSYRNREMSGRTLKITNPICKLESD